MRIVITGMGIVSPIGIGVPQFWDSLMNGRYGIKPITRFDITGFSYTSGGEVNEITDSSPQTSTAEKYLLIAAKEAIESANINTSPENPKDIGIILGTNFGDTSAMESLIETFISHKKTCKPDIVQSISFQSCSDKLAEYFACRGPRSTVSLSCSSGTAAIAYAASLIEAGISAWFVTGGYDVISRFAWAGLSALRTMTTEKIRPFEKKRNGTIFSEGAGILIVEELNHALSRHAPILAELLGYSMNNNAFHMTAPDKNGEGMANAMRTALACANLAPEKIEHINSHGTGTKYNDLAETQAIKSIFGKHAFNIPINSIKSMTGHMMGAAGAVEAIATILTIQKGWIPPTINYEEKDPDCDLDYVPNKPRQHAVKIAMSNSAGIGGNNSSVILGAWNEQ